MPADLKTREDTEKLLDIKFTNQEKALPGVKELKYGDKISASLTLACDPKGFPARGSVSGKFEGAKQCLFVVHDQKVVGVEMNDTVVQAIKKVHSFWLPEFHLL
jgi:hypothetical protein